MVDKTNELQLRAVRAKVVLNKKGMKPMDEYVQTGGKCSEHDRTVQKKLRTYRLKLVERGKTLLLQRVKELNDVTVIDCAIVMHAPRGDIL